MIVNCGQHEHRFDSAIPFPEFDGLFKYRQRDPHRLHVFSGFGVRQKNARYVLAVKPQLIHQVDNIVRISVFDNSVLHQRAAGLPDRCLPLGKLI